MLFWSAAVRVADSGEAGARRRFAAGVTIVGAGLAPPVAIRIAIIDRPSNPPPSARTVLFLAASAAAHRSSTPQLARDQFDAVLLFAPASSLFAPSLRQVVCIRQETNKLAPLVFNTPCLQNAA